MTLLVKEIQAITILSASKIYPYVINPYTGCQHGCSYCYARFMKRVTGDREPWGEFVDVKINAADLLRKEIKKKKQGRVWVSGVCDPYQPLEATYRVTRQCLEILAAHRLRSPFQTRTRHLAAIGLSEETDAAVIVVSEETGTVSLDLKGQLERFDDVDAMKKRLLDYLKDR